jgi:multimeric flavodoxin WrbA
MKVLAFNGSPREHWNTAQLLGKALEGAASQGAETQLVHLYEIDFKGCTSCFSCKIRRARPVPCCFKDPLTPFLAGGGGRCPPAGIAPLLWHALRRDEVPF